MQDPNPMVEALLKEASRRLSINYETYWPCRGHGDPNERDLTCAFVAATHLLHTDWATFTEVPFRGSSEKKLDLLILPANQDVCWLVESKNIESSKMRNQVIQDLRKMQTFVPKSSLRSGAPFPKGRVRITLMMGWTSDEHAEDPYSKPAYGQLRQTVAQHFPGICAGKVEIPRTNLAVPYCHQWLMYFTERRQD